MRQRKGSIESGEIYKLDARIPLDLNLLKISSEFLIDQINSNHSFHNLLYNIL